jgi:hypothetical protein
LRRPGKGSEVVLCRPVSPILVPIVLSKEALTEAGYRAVVRHRARRVYTFVPHDVGLGKLTGLRLEAISGRVIDASRPLVYSRQRPGE